MATENLPVNVFRFMNLRAPRKAAAEAYERRYVRYATPGSTLFGILKDHRPESGSRALMIADA